MTVEELEEEVHHALDHAAVVNVRIGRTVNDKCEFAINGVHFEQPSRKMVFKFLSLFFLKASTMDLP